MVSPPLAGVWAVSGVEEGPGCSHTESVHRKKTAY